MLPQSRDVAGLFLFVKSGLKSQASHVTDASKPPSSGSFSLGDVKRLSGKTHEGAKEGNFRPCLKAADMWALLFLRRDFGQTVNDGVHSFTCSQTSETINENITDTYWLVRKGLPSNRKVTGSLRSAGIYNDTEIDWRPLTSVAHCASRRRCSTRNWWSALRSIINGVFAAWYSWVSPYFRKGKSVQSQLK